MQGSEMESLTREQHEYGADCATLFARLNQDNISWVQGSVVGRLTPEQHKHGVDPILKDLDLKERVQLGVGWRSMLLAQLKIDCELLENLEIIDYSLLLGVHHCKGIPELPKEESAQGSDASGLAHGTPGAGESLKAPEPHYNSVETHCAQSLHSHGVRSVGHELNAQGIHGVQEKYIDSERPQIQKPSLEIGQTQQDGADLDEFGAQRQTHIERHCITDVDKQRRGKGVEEGGCAVSQHRDAELMDDRGGHFGDEYERGEAAAEHGSEMYSVGQQDSSAIAGPMSGSGKECVDASSKGVIVEAGNPGPAEGSSLTESNSAGWKARGLVSAADSNAAKSRIADWKGLSSGETGESSIVRGASVKGKAGGHGQAADSCPVEKGGLVRRVLWEEEQWERVRLLCCADFDSEITFNPDKVKLRVTNSGRFLV